MSASPFAALSRLLTSSGYRRFHLTFGDGNRSFRKWERHLSGLDPDLGDLVQLFLLQRCLEIQRARELLGDDIYDALSGQGILVEVDDGVRTPGLILISFKALAFFHQFTKRPGIYFGNDSIALGVYQSPAHGGTTLDLCSGTSIQAMISAQHAARSVAVEINPVAARVAAVNLELNGLESKVVLVNRSLEDYAGEADSVFDLITFNPPLLPVPEPLDYPFVGDGGGDGLDVTRLTLELYLPLLSGDGGIECIGCGLGTDRMPTFVDDLSEILDEHEASGRLQLLARYDMRRGDPFYNGLIETAAMNSLISADLSDAVFDLHFDQLGVNELYTFILRGERNRDYVTDGSALTVTDVSDGGDCWFQ